MKTKEKRKVKVVQASDGTSAQEPVVQESAVKETTAVGSPKKIATKKVVAASDTDKVKAVKPPKKDKPKKIKMVRDSFTMPEYDYAILGELKKKCLESGVHAKKSELLRAGLICLAKLGNADLMKEVAQVEVIKTGRPAAA
jgi:hypothetical protein